MPLPFLNNDDTTNGAVPFVAQKEISKDAENQIIIQNQAFFPDLKLLDFQMRYRVDGSHHEARQLQALKQAMLDINAYLTATHPSNRSNNWVERQQLAGYNQLADIPGNDLGEMKEKVFLYETAVFAKAKEILVDRWPEFFFGRKSRSSKEEPEHNTAEMYHNESKMAVYQIIGARRLSCALI